MQIQGQIEELLESGEAREAVNLLKIESARGSPWADFALAECYLEGSGCSRDAVAAVNLLERAGAAGFVPAAMRLVSLYATGTGCSVNLDRAHAIIEFCKSSDQFAAAQFAVLAIEPDKEHVEFTQLHERADVRLFRGAVSKRECAWIRTLATPQLQPSVVIEPATGRLIPHPIRTSSGMSFGPLNEDLVISRINRRIARLSGTDCLWGEPLHILRYLPGEQYREHIDALPGVKNQRLKTAIIYLNDCYEGGMTAFPELDLQIEGREGDILLFSNVENDGNVNQSSRHSGLPVEHGEKWIATRWIRQSNYHPWD